MFDALNFSLLLSPQFLVFLSLAITTMFSEDISCISTGILVAAGKLDLHIAVLGCASGIIMGDSLVFASARIFGNKLFSFTLFKRFKTSRLDAILSRVAKHPKKTLFATRFLPGTRLVTMIAVGFSPLPVKQFIPIFLVSVCLWTPTILFLAINIGSVLFNIISSSASVLFLVFCLVCISLWVLSTLNKKS